NPDSAHDNNPVGSARVTQSEPTSNPEPKLPSPSPSPSDLTLTLKTDPVELKGGAGGGSGISPVALSVDTPKGGPGDESQSTGSELALVPNDPRLARAPKTALACQPGGKKPSRRK